MKTTFRSATRMAVIALGLSLFASCGGGGGSSGGGMRNFNSGTGFNGTVISIKPARPVSSSISGDMYVIGNFTEYNGVTVNGMVRLNRDGSRDTGFDVAAGFDGGTAFAMETIDDSTGDIYAAGNFTSFRGNPKPRIVRVNPDGTEGFVDFGTGFNDLVFALALNDGRGDLYAGGFFDIFRGNAGELARVNPDGSSDPGFFTGSGLSAVFGGGVQGVLVQSLAVAGTGNIYAVGIFTEYRGNPRSGIVRLLPNGDNDGSFNPGSGFSGGRFVPNTIALAHDGSNAVYVGGGFTSYNGIDRIGITRINPNGSDDDTFVTGAGFTGGLEEVLDIAVTDDGSGDIYVGGHFTSYDGAPAFRIARLNSDGALDTGFATGSGFNDFVQSIAMTTDGSGDVLVGGGFTQYNGTPVGRIVRLNADGSLD